MKFILLLLFLVPARSSEPDKVFVCKSGTSYAYHRKLCQGLKKCTHQIDTVTIQEAVASGHKEACGYCYRK